MSAARGHRDGPAFRLRIDRNRQRRFERRICGIAQRGLHLKRTSLCIQRGNIDIVHGDAAARLKIHALPDTTVVELARILREACKRFFDVDVILGQAAVPVLIDHAHDKGILPLHKRSRHREAEARVAILVTAEEVPVQPDLRAVIDRIEAQPPFIGQIFHGEGLFVPDNAVEGVRENSVRITDLKLTLGC